LAQHSPTFLTSPAWTELPWKHSSKSHFDQVLDFVALTPDVFRQGDALQYLEGHSLLLTTLGIVDQCWKLDAELQGFFERLEHSALGPLYWPKLSKDGNPADNPELGKLFPVCFHFLNLRMANTLMFYWATVLMLWNGFFQLYGIISSIQLDKRTMSGLEDDGSCEDEVSTQYDMSQLPPLGHRTDFGSVARNICQSVEYCMQDEMLGAGPPSVIAPLNIVIDTLQSHPQYHREVLWAKAAIDRVEKRGMRFLKYWDRL
jgi:hypothetical protein